MSKHKWFEEESDFFGDFYIEGDESLQGYRELPQSLKERTKVEVNGVIFLLKLNKGAKVLDLPCGYGRHSIDLAKKGFDVVGSDLNSKHLAKAKENADKEKVPIIFRQENMLDLNDKEKFDAVINMFYSFGFFEKDEDNLKVLKNIFDSLKKGGKFLFHTDVNIPRILKKKYKFEEVRDLSSGNKLKVIDNYDSKTKRIDGSWIITKKDGSEIRRDYSVRVYTKGEFSELCKQVGFKKITVYSDWNGQDYSSDSEDMIVVAEK